WSRHARTDTRLPGRARGGDRAARGRRGAAPAGAARYPDGWGRRRRGAGRVGPLEAGPAWPVGRKVPILEPRRRRGASMSNPYLSRGPVRDPHMLFGRSHELSEIAAFIRGAQSISIVGPRKIGKTSIIYQLMRPAAWPGIGLGEDNLFVYLDCETLGGGGHAQFFEQFAAEIAAPSDDRGHPPDPTVC